MTQIVQFEAFNSVVETEFWAGLAQHKLHSAKLDTARTSIQGEYLGGRRHVLRNAGDEEQQRMAVPARLRVGQAAWGGESTTELPAGAVAVTGYLYNTNTVEEFRKMDKGELLRSIGGEVMTAIQDGRATKEPGLLWPFVLLSFADLKRYKFTHWFGFPAVTVDPADTLEAMSPLASCVSEQAHLGLLRSAYREQNGVELGGAFLVRYESGSKSSNGVWRLFSLDNWTEAFAEGEAGQTWLAFIDPSSHTGRLGWPLRNLLAWVRHVHPETSRVRVLGFRDASICLGGSGEEIPVDMWESVVADIGVTPANYATTNGGVKVSGWERDVRGRLAPRSVDLAAAMDPQRLAASALDLNLQLMRWRLAPEVDLETMANTRVLLIGAGTLGAYTARALLAWGVRKMTFVDNGTVSFSNPARQPLYEFEDSLGGGKPKAQAAADALRRVFPGVDAQGIRMNVPMPGHAVAVGEEKSTKEAVEKLEELVCQHDVVFLLTDSRESRWLPTLLGAVHDRLVICVALGFDSFVAMRHGATKVSESERLGCYFCNDVVAPTDSLADRTLDQQCTVTRPGLAPIASGTAAELMATTLQHPKGHGAPASVVDNNDEDQDDKAVFGLPAHQIRGYLRGFRQHTIVGQASNLCTGCSNTVVAAYREHGFEFLKRVFNNTVVLEEHPHCPVDDQSEVPAGYSYLETLTGLAALHRQTDDILADIELTDDEDEFEEI
ncbi:Autophagy protein 7 [Coemansia sp. Benny D115]|nr:Autophagy protein 7 [Coemansia sp. Benny D115]